MVQTFDKGRKVETYISNGSSCKCVIFWRLLSRRCWNSAKENFFISPFTRNMSLVFRLEAIKNSKKILLDLNSFDNPKKSSRMPKKINKEKKTEERIREQAVERKEKSGRKILLKIRKDQKRMEIIRNKLTEMLKTQNFHAQKWQSSQIIPISLIKLWKRSIQFMLWISLYWTLSGSIKWQNNGIWFRSNSNISSTLNLEKFQN